MRSRDELVPGPGSGRGAWLCRDSAACLARAVAQRAFDRAFGVAISETALEVLGRRLTSTAPIRVDPHPDEVTRRYHP